MINKTWEIFIAHAAADKIAAETLYDLLAPDVKVFLDSRRLLPGDNWDEELSAAQRSSLITIVLISSKTEQAYYQREEIASAINMARENKDGHRVVPIYLNNPGDNIPYGLRLKQGLSVEEEGGLGETAERLKDLLRRLEKRNLSQEMPVKSPIDAPPQKPFSISLAVLNLNENQQIHFGISKIIEADKSVSWKLDFKLEEQKGGEKQTRINLSFLVDKNKQKKAEELISKGLSSSQINYLRGPVFACARALLNGEASNKDLNEIAIGILKLSS